MIERRDIQNVVRGYDLDKVKLGMVASHSALDVCDGAVEEGFPTLAICQKGRENEIVVGFLSDHLHYLGRNSSIFVFADLRASCGSFAPISA